jgi:hypothetical protein
MTTQLNALSYADTVGLSDLITVSPNVAQGADFRLGNGDDILKDQPPAGAHGNGIDVWTGTGNDTIQTANGNDVIWANGGGKKSITVGNGSDAVHLDQTNLASSFVNLHDTDQAQDVIYFNGQTQINKAGGVGEHTIQGIGTEDAFVFANYGHLFVHDVDNSVTGAFDYVTRGTVDGPVVAKFTYETEFVPNAVHPHLVEDGFNHFTMHFDLYA